MTGTGQLAVDLVGQEYQPGPDLSGKVTCYRAKGIAVKISVEADRNRGLPVHDGDGNFWLTVDHVSYSSGRT